MTEAAENLQFELAAALRDKIAEIKQMSVHNPVSPAPER